MSLRAALAYELVDQRAPRGLLAEPRVGVRKYDGGKDEKDARLRCQNVWALGTRSSIAME